MKLNDPGSIMLYRPRAARITKQEKGYRYDYAVCRGGRPLAG